MREKGQQSAKILTHLVTYRGKKEKCLFILYVGRCKGKTDICLFLSLFFYEPFPNSMLTFLQTKNNIDKKFNICVVSELIEIPLQLS